MLINMCTCELPHTYFETHREPLSFTCGIDIDQITGAWLLLNTHTHTITHTYPLIVYALTIIYSPSLFDEKKHCIFKIISIKVIHVNQCIHINWCRFLDATPNFDIKGLNLTSFTLDSLSPNLAKFWTNKWKRADSIALQTWDRTTVPLCCLALNELCCYFERSSYR